ncbi:MAG: 3-deoxy-manno-octulosonate cytidylyltransferase [Candidatus Aminicenantes bacterium]|nr:3-deoxy-manno-octulosonate cytidylyltransferase [Candidatus Aminicenantes bacterium]
MILNRAAAIIPVRYDSRRFPGKALAPILGKPMIQWVYEGVKQARLVDKVIIATDDRRIQEEAQGFGAAAVMTSKDHGSGTERAAEIAQDVDNKIIINIQGDEPLISGRHVDSLIETLEDGNIPTASLMTRVNDTASIDDPNMVKVAVDINGYALYFSRSPLPYRAADFFYLHIGIYGFQRDFLLRFPGLRPSRLERTEKLEQLRILENGFRIRMIEVPHPALSVDTPRDIIRVEEVLRKRNHA